MKKNPSGGDSLMAGFTTTMAGVSSFSFAAIDNAMALSKESA